MCSAPWYAARSGPRSARAAGRNATPAAATLANAGGQSRAPQRTRCDRSSEDGAEHARPLEREARLRNRATHGRQEHEGLRDRDRAAQDRHALAQHRREVRLATRRDMQDAVPVPDRAAPRRRPVHENAVLQRHPSEPNGCLSHAHTVAVRSRSAAWSTSAAGPRPIARPSISTSGMNSRTDDDVNASSAPSSCSS